jgi:hypothetical protein
MHNSDTELLFPPRVIPSLRGLRNSSWDKLLEQVESSGKASREELAFVLMMAKLNGCISCNADSFRAMHGCTQCAKQTLHRYHGPDKELIAMYRECKTEVGIFLKDKI